MAKIVIETIFNSYYQGYTVKLYVDSMHLSKADYFTCDKQDATDAAGAMKQDAEKFYQWFLERRDKKGSIQDKDTN